LTLLTDDRFAVMVVLFGGLTQTEHIADRELLLPIAEGAVLLNPSSLTELPEYRFLVAVSRGIAGYRGIARAIFSHIVSMGEGQANFVAGALSGGLCLRAGNGLWLGIADYEYGLL